MNTTQPYTVRLLPWLYEELDSNLSPLDAIGAGEELVSVLPHLHAQVTRRPANDDSEPFLYWGRFGWVNIGFTYVEIGTNLLIVQFWRDFHGSGGRNTEVDCVLDDAAAALVFQRMGGVSA